MAPCFIRSVPFRFFFSSSILLSSRLQHHHIHSALPFVSLLDISNVHSFPPCAQHHGWLPQHRKPDLGPWPIQSFLLPRCHYIISAFIQSSIINPYLFFDAYIFKPHLLCTLLDQAFFDACSFWSCDFIDTPSVQPCDLNPQVVDARRVEINNSA